MLKKVLIGIGTLVVVLVAAVIAGAYFYDWNRFKGEIAAQVREQTGRELTIDGDITLTPFPMPTLTVTKVRFANLEGGAAADMATLESLDVRLAFSPLEWIESRFQVERIALGQPTILLERLADGRANWILEQSVAPEAEDAAPVPGDGPKVRLDSISITNGTVIYRDARTGSEQRIESVNADLGAASLQGPFQAEGSLAYQGVPIMFSLGAGALDAGSPAQINAQIGLARTDATLKFTGNVSTAPALAVDGRLELNSADLAAALESLEPGEAGGFPVALNQLFQLAGDVSYGQEGGEVKNLSLTLGDVVATGAAKFVPGVPNKVEVKLGLNRLDLDKLLATTASSTAAQPGAVPPGGAAETFSLPQGLDATVSLAVAAVNYRGGVINDAHFAADLAGGSLKVTELSALLPGGSKVAGAGTVVSADGAPRFEGVLEGKSDNLRGLLEWLQVAPGQIPADRLRTLELTTKVIATPAALKVEDVDLKLDSSSIIGAAEIALPGQNRPKAAFGVGLAVDQLNLDAYLPPTAKGQGDGGGRANGGLPLAGLAPLADIDANIDLRVGKLTLNEQTLQSVHIDGMLKGGTLTLRDLSVKEFAGGKGSLSGTITDLAGQPRFDTKFDLSAKDAAKAFQLAGLGKAPGKLGALKLEGTLAGGAQDVAYDVVFSIAGIGASGSAKGKATGIGAGIPRIDTIFDLKAKDAGPLAALAGLPAAEASRLGAVAVAGSAASGADDLTYDVTLSLGGIGGQGKFAGKIVALAATPKVDTRLDFSAKKPAPLLAMLGVAGPSATKLGQVGIAGTMAGNADNMRLDLGLQGFGGGAKIAGTVMAASAPTRFDLDVSASHPEFRDLLAALVPGYRPQARQLGAFALTAKATGSTQSAALSDLSLRAGETSLAGSLKYEQGGARPFVTANLRGGLVDLTPFSPPGEKGGGGGGERWSREPLDLAVLEAVDGDVDFAADRFISGDTVIDNLQAKLALRDGTLTITQFTGNTYGGAINLTGTLASRGVPSFKGHVVADNVDAGVVSGSRFVNGPLSLNADVAATGYSMAELMDALQGNGRVNGTVTVLGEVEQMVGAAALSVLGQQLAKVTGVQQVQGMTDYINAAYQAFVGRPNALSGNFNIAGGVLNTQDLSFANDQARALLTGDANLSAWTIGMLVNVFSAQFPDQPCLMVDLAGILDSPTPRPRGGGGCGSGAGAAPFGGLDPNELFGTAIPGLPGGEDVLPGALEEVLPGLVPGLPGGGDTTGRSEPAGPELIVPEILPEEPVAEPKPESVPETPEAAVEQPAPEEAPIVAPPGEQPEQPAAAEQPAKKKEKKKKKKDTGEAAAPTETVEPAPPGEAPVEQAPTESVVVPIEPAPEPLPEPQPEAESVAPTEEPAAPDAIEPVPEEVVPGAEESGQPEPETIIPELVPQP